nr:PREDICTED: olfactory receptor 7A17-like [Equus przewalskii]
MVPGNGTQNSEFLLLGLSKEQELEPLIFGLFIFMYLATILGNLLIILATVSDSHLHTPMYFFLSNLSFVDICFTSTTIPKMLVNIQTQSKVITYKGCISQMYFYILFAVLDDFHLAVMAYDRFLAICHPLSYTVMMSPQLCKLLVLISWLISALHSLLESLMVLRLSFCTDLEIPHFFCEIKQVIRLACSDYSLSDTVMYVTAVLLAGGALAGILYSYSKLVSSICGIPSAQGKYKAFSTCVSHLSVVSLYYFSSLGVYLLPAPTHSSRSSAAASVMYTVVTPMLNPFVYSLRNKDIQRALKRLLGLRLWLQALKPLIEQSHPEAHRQSYLLILVLSLDLGRGGPVPGTTTQGSLLLPVPSRNLEYPPSGWCPSTSHSRDHHPPFGTLALLGKDLDTKHASSLVGYTGSPAACPFTEGR